MITHSLPAHFYLVLVHGDGCKSISIFVSSPVQGDHSDQVSPGEVGKKKKLSPLGELMDC